MCFLVLEATIGFNKRDDEENSSETTSDSFVRTRPV